MLDINKIKELINQRYYSLDLKNKYQDYCDRYDVCFEGGYEKGYSKALYDISRLIDMDLELPEDYDEE